MLNVLPTRLFNCQKLLCLTIAMAGLLGPVKPLAGQVLNGIDSLVLSSFKPLAGLRVGLITNHSGLAQNGKSTIDLLHAAPGLNLVKLFSPEHGIRGIADGKIGDSVDSRTGLKVHSLYGASRKPDAASLRGLDALVFDIQDIGCRFYTYISTMGNCMEAARSSKLKFFVLDRVNPIGGNLVEGPILSGKRSFTGYHEIPVRHGMTVGELAKLFLLERFSGLDLTVVPVRNWKRDQLFSQTGLPWVNPSPNIRNLKAAIMYPGIGLLEFTNLSVGRGTASPFELVGAPYIKPGDFANELNRAHLPGVEFKPATFTPESSIFKGQACGGVRIILLDPNARTVDLGITLGVVLRKLYPGKWDAANLDKLLVHPPSAKAILAGISMPKIRATWQKDLAAFDQRRSRALIYKR
jgi:uncharacterized protein YbbC (DUF1343 family)